MYFDGKAALLMRMRTWWKLLKGTLSGVYSEELEKRDYEFFIFIFPYDHCLWWYMERWMRKWLWVFLRLSKIDGTSGPFLSSFYKNDPHCKSGYQPSVTKDITSPSPPSLWLICFVTGNLRLVIALPFLSSHHPSDNHLFVLSTTLLCLSICFLDSTRKWNHMLFVFLWLLSLKHILQDWPRCCRWQNFILF